MLYIFIHIEIMSKIDLFPITSNPLSARVKLIGFT